MKHPVRVNPIFYNRLQWALDNIARSLDAEIEFIGRHLTQVETEFSESWDSLLQPDDSGLRYVFGSFASIEAIFAVGGRMHDGVIVIWSIRIVLDPTI